MTKHRLIVRPHRPGRAWVLRLFGLVLVAAAIFGVFRYGQQRAGFDRSVADQRIAELTQSLRAVRRDSEELGDQLALLEHSSVVDRRARDTVQGSISDMQKEILELREELEFYRGIVSPEDAEAGLKIQDFAVNQGPDPRLYHYRLVLIQAIKHDKRASGTVDVIIYGIQGGEPVGLNLKELAVGGLEGLTFSFKYFQGFEGDLFLPEDFLPGRIEVTVFPGGRQRDAFRRSFNWPARVG
ncbi:MAG: DUF6776 family protein [Gammaproteobacteria bacterium]